MLSLCEWLCNSIHMWTCSCQASIPLAVHGLGLFYTSICVDWVKAKYTKLSAVIKIKFIKHKWSWLLQNYLSFVAMRTLNVLVKCNPRWGRWVRFERVRMIERYTAREWGKENAYRKQWRRRSSYNISWKLWLARYIL